MAGLPHFKEVEFEGTYPLARLEFIDEQFPGKVGMTAFNPFIPLNDKDSSIPGAFFEIEVENILAKPVIYTIALSLNNPLTPGATINRYSDMDRQHILMLSSSKLGADEVGFGDLCFATDAEDTSYQEYWYRGTWFDNVECYWRDFTAPGKLKNRTYPPIQGDNQQYPGGSDVATLAAHINLNPREIKKVRFVITWSFPNCTNFWNPEKCDCVNSGCATPKAKTWKNYYATVYENSAASAHYSLKNWQKLYDETLNFKDALFSSTIPAEALDAVSANISILKTPTCLRLEDGSFYGFEGCHCDEGCCEGTCTHVWNYAYALPFLFPKLERSMRDLDFKYNQRADGSMAFRLQLPIGRERSTFRACADGQFGGVIKTYREWKISGNDQWLRSNWEAVKKSIEFAWSPTNEDRWDMDKDGVLKGRQHHTLDMELFGPNAWLTGFYLAALKAGAEMADYLGEKDTTAEYMDLFNRGKTWVDKNLFNGEYYQQLIDLTDKTILEKYDEGKTMFGDNTTEGYWNKETGEMKYQIGEGCGIDQVLAQWHANLCGIGEIFDSKQVHKALQSIYQYNFKKSMRNFFNPCRLYSLNDEAGVVICEWPKGKYKPVVPIPYAEETMYGFEYQVAVHMIQEGLTAEGMEIIRAIRSRFDGEKRNPWNEFECGSNYARSMASYALLNVFSGFEFDMVKGMVGFDPIFMGKDEFKCFWSLDSGYGTFEATPGNVALKILNGKLEIKKIKLPFIKDKQIKSISLGDKPVDFVFRDGSVAMHSPIEIDQTSAFIVAYE